MNKGDFSYFAYLLLKTSLQLTITTKLRKVSSQTCLGYGNDFVNIMTFIWMSANTCGTPLRWTAPKIFESGQTYETVISHETSSTLEVIHPRSHLLLQCGQDWCLGSSRAPSLECLMVSYVNQRSCMKTSKTQRDEDVSSLLHAKSLDFTSV